MSITLLLKSTISSIVFLKKPVAFNPLFFLISKLKRGMGGIDQFGHIRIQTDAWGSKTKEMYYSLLS